MSAKISCPSLYHRKVGLGIAYTSQVNVLFPYISMVSLLFGGLPDVHLGLAENKGLYQYYWEDVQKDKKKRQSKQKSTHSLHGGYMQSSFKLPGEGRCPLVLSLLLIRSAYLGMVWEQPWVSYGRRLLIQIFLRGLQLYTAISINVVGSKNKATRQDLKILWIFLWISSSKSAMPLRSSEYILWRAIWMKEMLGYQMD